MYVQSIATLGGHTSSILSLDRAADRAVSGSLSGEVYMWNLLTEQLTMRAHTAEGMAVNALVWHAHAHTHTHMHTYAHTHIHTHTHTHTYVEPAHGALCHVRAYGSKRLAICLYVTYIHTHIHTCTHTCTHTHARIHTHVESATEAADHARAHVRMHGCE